MIDSFFYKTNQRTSSKGISVLKSISWRIIGSIDTFLVAYFITGNTSTAFSIGGIEICTKMVLYYIHERAWKNLEYKKG